MAALLFCCAAPSAYAQKTVIAIVDTRAFPTEIVEYKKQIELLSRELESSTREVQKLASDLRNYEIDLNTNRLNYTEQVRRERTAQLEELRRQYKRKSEDLEAAVKKKAEQSVNPIRDKVLKALQEFATARGISLLFDLGTAAERGGILYVSPKIDITAEFVKFYNQSPRR
jgi:Skp family chaperone for outer membrane proteins